MILPNYESLHRARFSFEPKPIEAVYHVLKKMNANDTAGIFQTVAEKNALFLCSYWILHLYFSRMPKTLECYLLLCSMYFSFCLCRRLLFERQRTKIFDFHRPNIPQRHQAVSSLPRNHFKWLLASQTTQKNLQKWSRWSIFLWKRRNVLSALGEKEHYVLSNAYAPHPQYCLPTHDLSHFSCIYGRATLMHHMQCKNFWKLTREALYTVCFDTVGIWFSISTV